MRGALCSAPAASDCSEKCNLVSERTEQTCGPASGPAPSLATAGQLLKEPTGWRRPGQLSLLIPHPSSFPRDSVLPSYPGLAHAVLWPPFHVLPLPRSMVEVPMGPSFTARPKARE